MRPFARTIAQVVRAAARMARIDGIPVGAQEETGIGIVGRNIS